MHNISAYTKLPGIQTFLQINPFVACKHRARPNSATIDLLKIEKRVRLLAPCGSHDVKFLIHDWFVH